MLEARHDQDRHMRRHHTTSRSHRQLHAARRPIHEVNEEHRPTWSVMIPVHNCAGFLARTLPEVVAQLGARDDAEIVVVDDGSSDDPKAVVDSFAGAVGYVRNEVALGAVANFNRCLDLSRGHIVHLLHGDDMILPGFYDVMESSLADPNMAASFCRTEYVDDRDVPMTTTRSECSPSGPWDSAVDRLAISNRVRPASIVIRRDVYESIGGFREDLPHSADWEMWMRVASAGRIWFEDRVLAQYRVHDGQDTATRVRDGVNIRERINAIHIVSEHVDLERRTRLVRGALAYSSAFALRTVGRELRRRDISAAVAQLRECVRCLGLAVTGDGPGTGEVSVVGSSYSDSLRRCSHATPGPGNGRSVPIVFQDLNRPEPDAPGTTRVLAEHRHHVAP